MPTLRSRKKLVCLSLKRREGDSAYQWQRITNPRNKSEESVTSLWLIRQQIFKSRDRQSYSENSMPTNKLLDSITDPEPDMERRQAPFRNMRSKCRCSYVLQFTFRRAVSCVLHRPPSQVIHCTMLFKKD